MESAAGSVPPSAKSTSSISSKTVAKLGPAASGASSGQTVMPTSEQARMLASEAKSIEVAVLRLFDSATSADEIDETIFGNYEETARYENPFVQIKGVCQVRRCV